MEFPKEVVSGYIGGTGKNPTYENYAERGFIEAVRITYDPSVIPYEKLLDQFWLHIDPTDAGGQFCDRGHAYTTAIFYGTAEKKRVATAFRLNHITDSRREGNPKPNIMCSLRQHLGQTREEGSANGAI